MAKKDSYQLTAEDAIAILADVLRILRETGVPVGIRNAPAKVDRPAGIMIFAGNVELTGEGLTLVTSPDPQPVAAD